jgi:hypothetical protein
MQPKVQPVLSCRNAHRRDRRIHFEEVGHKYTITTDPLSEYTSVTTWNKSHFEEFDSDAVIASMMQGSRWKEGHRYWGLSPEEIKAAWSETGATAAGLGTLLHFQIECFMNNPELPPNYTHRDLYNHYMSYTSEQKLKQMTNEWQQFIKFVKDTPHLKPYRTEWYIFHGDLKLAGSIDMVYINPDNSLSIYDWKRTGKDKITQIHPYNKFSIKKCICHMPDTKFWHYALQLNAYKSILEQKYNHRISELCLVQLHPEINTYKLHPLPDLHYEIEDLFQEKKTKLNTK